MSDQLRIMVRETKTELRALTREEAYAWGTQCSRLWISKGAGAYLKSIGYVDGTYQRDSSPYGSAEFTSTTLREATQDEIDAWHTLSKTKHLVSCLLCDSHKKAQEFASTRLKDKEILLEVVKGGGDT